MKLKVLEPKLCPILLTPWTVACWAPLSMGFCRQEYWSGCRSLLQGIFSTQGSNPGLLHCRQILYHLSYQWSLGKVSRGLMNEETDPSSFRSLSSKPHKCLRFGGTQSVKCGDGRCEKCTSRNPWHFFLRSRGAWRQAAGEWAQEKISSLPKWE